jgi:hypothetical protein
MPHDFGFTPVAQGETGQDGPRKSSLDPFLSRTNYFDGRLLKASDLIRDQQYVDERLLQNGRVLGAGVISGLHAKLTPQHHVTVTPGMAITDSGRVLELTSALDVDLTDRATIDAVNEQSFRYFNRGLYAVVLRYSEKGVGIAEAYPEDIGKTTEPRISSYEEGVELVVVPLRERYPLGSDLAARASLADGFLQFLQPLAEIPSDGVALALLAIDKNRLLWLDRSLLYRPAGIQQDAKGFQRLLAAHYEELLIDVQQSRNLSSLNNAFSASQYFQWLPPAGSIPKQVVDPDAGTQQYFPASFNVSIVPVRQEDLAVLMDEAMRLEAIDLKRDASVDIMILAPLNDADFNLYGRRLEQPTAVVEQDVFALSARLLPTIMPLSLHLRPIRKLPVLEDRPSQWSAIWSRVQAGQLRYIRRPARVAENHVSTVVLARGFELPDTVPGDTSEIEILTQQLTQAQQQRDNFAQQLEQMKGQLTSVISARNQLQQDLNACLAGTGTDNPQTLAQQIVSRGVIDKETQTAARKLVDLIGSDSNAQKQVQSILGVVDNIYDRALWPSLLQIQQKRNMDKLLDLMRSGEPLENIMLQQGRDLGLTDATLKLWEKTVVFLRG